MKCAETQPRVGEERAAHAWAVQVRQGERPKCLALHQGEGKLKAMYSVLKSFGNLLPLQASIPA